MKILTRESVREIDRKTIKDYGISGLILMENAGKSAANVVLSHYPECREVAIICGSGNNGGDGFVIARHLISAGIHVVVYLAGEKSKYKRDAKTNLNSLSKLGGKIVELKGKINLIKKADLYIDAIFGTGLDRKVEGFYSKLIKFLNSQKKPVFSVDIPSGLDSNSGKPLGSAVKAESTVTFIKPKIGMCLFPGAELTGRLFITDLSTPKLLEENADTELLTFNECSKLIKQRDKNSHKGTHGHLYIIAGSRGKSGAAILTANAAIRSGAGLVTAGIPNSINYAFETNCIEGMSVPLDETGEGTLDESAIDTIFNALNNRKSALAIGPGISTNKKTRNIVEKIIAESKVPVVVDADALNIISEDLKILKQSKSELILTPHPGEMARLCNLTGKDVQDNRVEIARDFATKHKCILILKGARTVIASPEGRIYINPTGNPGMATGGMGDALTGIVAGLAAQGYECLDSSILGTFIHGFAGDICALERGSTGFTAGDLISKIPEAFRRIPDTDEQYFTLVR